MASASDKSVCLVWLDAFSHGPLLCLFDSEAVWVQAPAFDGGMAGRDFCRDADDSRDRDDLCGSVFGKRKRMKKNTQLVIFRTHCGTGQVMALLPGDTIHTDGNCLSFQTVVRKETLGRTENYRRVMGLTRPATPNEAQDLLKEVRTICDEQGLKVELRKKWSPRKKAKEEKIS